MSKVISAAKQVWSAKDQITRNIWLAGLGAYDKGYESASNTVTKSQSIFDELVERGRKLEADTTQTFSTQKGKLATASQTATEALQGKVHSAVTNLTHIDANAFDNIIDKIEQIELALADAKSQQQTEAEPVSKPVQDIVEKVDVAVTEKASAVAAEVKSVAKEVDETVSAEITPVIATVTDAAKPVVAQAVDKVVAVKPTAKKVTNRRVKKNVAKKKQ